MIHIKCANCGSEDIEKITPDKGGNYYLNAANDDLELDEKSGLLVLVMRCTACGNLSMSAPDVRKFLSL